MLGRASIIFFLCTGATMASASSKNPLEACEQNKPPIGLVSSEQQQLMDRAGELLVRNSALRMAAGRDSTLADIYKAPIGQEDPVIKQLVTRLGGDQYRRVVAHQISADEFEYKQNIASKIASKKLRAAAALCYQAHAVYKPQSKENKALRSYLDTVLARPSTARIEHFDITVDSCEVRDTVGARNQAAEPDAWTDSRYLVIQAGFKNTDTEGRLPLAGSVLLTMGGKTLEYDHTETVLEQGFGIGLRPVGPLLTLRTKIVYRIPREATGEIFWRPGRNPEQIQLWCSSI